MSVRVVLDTNVVVFAALTPGPPSVCVEMALDGSVMMVASVELLEEYAEVLGRPRFRFPAGLVSRYIAELRRCAVLAPAAPIPLGITHDEVRVLTPAQFLADLIARGQ